MEAVTLSPQGDGRGRSRGGGQEEGSSPGLFEFTRAEGPESPVAWSVYSKHLQAESDERKMAIASLTTFLQEAIASVNARVDEAIQATSYASGNSSSEAAAARKVADGCTELANSLDGADAIRGAVARLGQVQGQQEERLRTLSHRLDETALGQSSSERDQKASYREVSQSVGDLSCKLSGRVASLEADLRRCQEDLAALRHPFSLA
ncbi:unnamed protein product, partial [Polarella glacialis]